MIIYFDLYWDEIEYQHPAFCLSSKDCLSITYYMLLWSGASLIVRKQFFYSFVVSSK